MHNIEKSMFKTANLAKKKLLLHKHTVYSMEVKHLLIIDTRQTHIIFIYATL